MISFAHKFLVDRLLKIKVRSIQTYIAPFYLFIMIGYAELLEINKLFKLYCDYADKAD